MFYMLKSDREKINIAGSGRYISDVTDLKKLPRDFAYLIPENYLSDLPVNLVFSTCRAQDPDVNLIIAQASPGQCVYAANHTRDFSDFSQIHRLHRHNFYELMFVIEGTVYQNIEHKRHLYPAGSCCLMNRNIYHTEEYSGSFRTAFLQLSPDFAAALFSRPSCFPGNISLPFSQAAGFFRRDLHEDSVSDKKYIDFIPEESEPWIRSHIHACFEKLFLLTQETAPSSVFYFEAILTDLLCFLFDDAHYKKTPIHFGTTAERNLFDAITRYLSSCHGRASRKDLEAHFHYSGDYLYKIVQKYTGLSIFEYGMKFCFREAEKLLSSTSLSVSEIARRLGFTNQTHFYRLFKQEYHMTPKAWRSDCRNRKSAVK